jgi:Cysteine rich repeat
MPSTAADVPSTASRPLDARQKTFDPGKPQVNNPRQATAAAAQETSGMSRYTLTSIGRIASFVLISSGSITPCVAQQPTQGQISAIRQACRADYQTYCASVPTGGSAALACLQQNAQSLSVPCQRAVGAVGGSAPSAQSQRPPPAPAAPQPAAPAYSAPPPPMSPRQEAMLLRRSCAGDYKTYCGDVPAGGGRIIECLRANGPSLSRQCRSALFSARQAR